MIPDIENLNSVSSVFSKFSLNIWKFSVHILLKPGLENFEHNFGSKWRITEEPLDEGEREDEGE